MDNMMLVVSLMNCGRFTVMFTEDNSTIPLDVSENDQFTLTGVTRNKEMM
jgi:hypothetical protein